VVLVEPKFIVPVITVAPETVKLRFIVTIPPLFTVREFNDDNLLPGGFELSVPFTVTAPMVCVGETSTSTVFPLEIITVSPVYNSAGYVEQLVPTTFQVPAALQFPVAFEVKVQEAADALCAKTKKPHITKTAANNIAKLR
jgi:hypothetical protein